MLILKVSRCGMIYLEPKGLGWKCLLESWLNTLPSTLHGFNRNYIRILFNRFMSPLLWLVELSGKVKVSEWMWSYETTQGQWVKDIHKICFQQMYVTSRSNLVWSCMNLFDTFMDDFYDEKYMETLSDLDIRAQLEVKLINICTTLWKYLL